MKKKTIDISPFMFAIGLIAVVTYFILPAIFFKKPEYKVTQNPAQKANFWYSKNETARQKRISNAIFMNYYSTMIWNGKKYLDYSEVCDTKPPYNDAILVYSGTFDESNILLFQETVYAERPNQYMVFANF